MAMVSRAALLVLALVACAWFGLAAQQAHDMSKASALLSGGRPLSEQQARTARSLLSSAGTLNPDLTVEELRGRLAFDQHQNAAAELIFASVARREPMNLAAWTQLAYAAAKARDRRTLIEAASRISALYPKLK
jgi:hypothetical protein